MNKKIFIGFNNTVVDTTKTLVEIYNSIYSESVDVNAIKQFNLLDSLICLGERYDGDIQKELADIYSSDAFWSKLETLKNVKETLFNLKADGYELVLYADSNIYNQKGFHSFVEKKLPMFDSLISLESFDSIQQIDMDECFNINNVVALLQNSNARTNIVVGKELKGNRNPGYFRITDWPEVIPYINQIYEMSMI